MSCGVVICSRCHREVHQDGVLHGRPPGLWTHCDDKTPRCDGATSDYPQRASDIVGEWCGADACGEPLPL